MVSAKGDLQALGRDDKQAAIPSGEVKAHQLTIFSKE